MQVIFCFSLFDEITFERMRSTSIAANISVESAYISGFTFFFVIEYMKIGRVSKPLVVK